MERAAASAPAPAPALSPVGNGVDPAESATARKVAYAAQFETVATAVLLTPNHVLDVLVDAVNCSLADPEAAGKKLQPILEMLMKRGDPAGLRAIIDPIVLADTGEDHGHPRLNTKIAKLEDELRKRDSMIERMARRLGSPFGNVAAQNQAETPSPDRVGAAPAAVANGTASIEPPIVAVDEVERLMQAEFDADRVTSDRVTSAPAQAGDDGTWDIPPILRRSRPTNLAA
jgi:hypothetical protein